MTVHNERGSIIGRAGRYSTHLQSTLGRSYAPQIAGSTLGFIAGNLPGAYYGYKWGKRVRDSYPMTPIPHKRRHSLPTPISRKRDLAYQFLICLNC